MTIGTPTVLFPVDGDGSVWAAGMAVSVRVTDRSVCRPLREMYLDGAAGYASMRTMQEKFKDTMGIPELDAGFVPMCIFSASIVRHLSHRMYFYKTCPGKECDAQFEFDVGCNACPICQLKSTGAAWAMCAFIELHFPSRGNHEVEFKGGRFTQAVVGEHLAQSTPAPTRSHALACLRDKFHTGKYLSVIGWARPTVKEETEALGDPMIHCTRFWNIRDDARVDEGGAGGDGDDHAPVGGGAGVAGGLGGAAVGAVGVPAGDGPPVLGAAHPGGGCWYR